MSLRTTDHCVDYIARSVKQATTPIFVPSPHEHREERSISIPSNKSDMQLKLDEMRTYLPNT